MKNRSILLAVAGLALVPIFYLFIPQSSSPPAIRPAAGASEPTPATAEPARANRFAHGPSAVTPSQPETNLISRLMNGDFPKLTSEQLETYLSENHRSVESLLGAFRISKDKALLKEAAERFPNDPRVAFAGFFQTDKPEERAQWAANFQKAAPDNALPDYLSALEAFRGKNPEQALQQLALAGAKPTFQDYSLDFMQASEEAYLSAGYKTAESKAISASQLELPQFSQLKEVAVDLTEMAKNYQQNGDPASAQPALQMAIQLGQRLQDASGFHTVIGELVGMAIERMALNSMDPNSVYGDSGQTVQQRIEQLQNNRSAIRSTVQNSEALLENLSEQDLTTYFDREKAFGEESAITWARNRLGMTSPTPAAGRSN